MVATSSVKEQHHHHQQQQYSSSSQMMSSSKRSAKISNASTVSNASSNLTVPNALCGLSDDEGTYQALSVVFEDSTNPRKKSKDSDAPPRPPLPTEMGGGMGGHAPRHDTTTDDESEEIFQHAPTPSQGPIMMAAHDLHQEVKQWSSK